LGQGWQMSELHSRGILQSKSLKKQLSFKERSSERGRAPVRAVKTYRLKFRIFLAERVGKEDQKINRVKKLSFLRKLHVAD